MQFYFIDWRHKHTHTRTPKKKLTRQVFIGGLQLEERRAGGQSLFLDLSASCSLRLSGVAGLEPATQCRSKPRQAILAGKAHRHTGHKRRRSVGRTPGRRRLASEDHQKTTLNSLPKTRRQLSTTLSRLAHARFSYPTLALPQWAESTLYAHIWSQARTNRLCPYLGRRPSVILVPIFGA